MKRHAFTLIELLVVVGIIAVLIGVLLPVLGRARAAASRVTCGSNLRQVGVSLQNYVTEYRGRLPWIEEPIWSPGYPGRNVSYSVDWRDKNADGTDRYPYAFANVMRPYVKDVGLLVCPSALTGYPIGAPTVTYRFAAANASDGISAPYSSYFAADGTANYIVNFKYLDYRKQKLEFVEIGDDAVGRLKHGVGFYYLARDFKVRNLTQPNVTQDRYRGTIAPHNHSYNQLRIDFSVILDTDDGTTRSETYP